jgi:hypothetical protein
MRQWLARLRGEKFDLQELPKLFDSADITVTEEDGNYYLKSAKFTNLANAEEVLTVAAEIVDTINDVLFFHLGNFRPAEIDAVTEVHEDGSRHHRVFLKGSVTPRSRVSIAHLTITDANGNVVESEQSGVAATLMDAAGKYRAVADALHFYRNSDWGSLYKVFEIIRDDVGGNRCLIQRGWVSKRVLSRFTRTAQSRDAIGDEARHASKKFTPPRHPMVLSEVRGVIRSILERWLQTK